MGAGIFNLVIGAFAIYGWSQGMVLWPTESNLALGIAGGVISALGIFQLVRHFMGRSKSPPPAPPEG